MVDSLDAAVAHIRRYGTGHTEAIVTDSAAAAREFVARVDAAAVMVNASTRFTDGGEFGFGAEIGISTQKLHARGPMGLPELTSTKYVVTGDGHTLTASSTAGRRHQPDARVAPRQAPDRGQRGVHVELVAVVAVPAAVAALGLGQPARRRHQQPVLSADADPAQRGGQPRHVGRGHLRHPLGEHHLDPRRLVEHLAAGAAPPRSASRRRGTTARCRPGAAAPANAWAAGLHHPGVRPADPMVERARRPGRPAPATVSQKPALAVR